MDRTICCLLHSGHGLLLQRCAAPCVQESRRRRAIAYAAALAGWSVQHNGRAQRITRSHAPLRACNFAQALQTRRLTLLLRRNYDFGCFIFGRIPAQLTP